MTGLTTLPMRCFFKKAVIFELFATVHVRGKAFLRHLLTTSFYPLGAQNPALRGLASERAPLLGLVAALCFQAALAYPPPIAGHVGCFQRSAVAHSAPVSRHTGAPLGSSS